MGTIDLGAETELERKQRYAAEDRRSRRRAFLGAGAVILLSIVGVIFFALNGPVLAAWACGMFVVFGLAVIADPDLMGVRGPWD